jgi:gamma-glutamyltranspeptidase/glutathione hydrolase
MNLRQAVEAPRVHHQWLPDVVNSERYGLSKDVIAALASKGHVMAGQGGAPAIFWGPYWGDAECVMVDPASGVRLGASDPRGGRSRAVGY